MERNFTIAALVAVLLELGMFTAAYFKNYKNREAKVNKTELTIPDARTPQQNELGIDIKD